MGAAVGQRGGDQRQVAAIHPHGALFKVQGQRGVGIIGHDAIVAQHVADGAVAVAGAAFRLEDGLVHGQRPAGVGRHRAQHARQPGRIVRAGHQRRRGNGAGVDHRVQRPAGARLQADGVEGIAGGFNADGLLHPGPAGVLQRHAVDQRFGHRLDRKAPP